MSVLKIDKMSEKKRWAKCLRKKKNVGENTYEEEIACSGNYSIHNQ